jgi:hypothetical protein
MNETTLHALAFARHGHPVFPLWWPVQGQDGRACCACGNAECIKSAAKHPHGRIAPHGPQSATTDSGVIKHWFGYILPDANLGVVTDQLIVVDVDPRDGGDESLAALEREHLDFPLTWRSLTGGGGEHIIFARPDGVEAGCVTAKIEKNPPLGSGIDIRARGGYIVAPPSRHISGRVYAWSVNHHPKDVGPLAVAPDWLIERLKTRATPDDGEPHVEPIGSDVWAGLMWRPITEYQDMAAAKISGHLFAHGCDYQLVLGLMHSWNSTWCKPALGGQELKGIVDRIARKEAAQRKARLAR